jgi:hypothetical protein
MIESAKILLRHQVDAQIFVYLRLCNLKVSHRLIAIEKFIQLFSAERNLSSVRPLSRLQHLVLSGISISTQIIKYTIL